MKLSCLVVTKNRPEFLPWLAWNIAKQTRLPDEIIVIDATLPTAAYIDAANDFYRMIPTDILVFHEAVPEAWTTGESRNRALELANHELITWVDDDDWHHPRKNEVLCAAIEKQGYDIAYVSNTHRLILDTMELINIGETDGCVSLPFCVIPAEYAKQHEFPATFTAEDVYWLAAVKEHCPKVYYHRTWTVPTIALIHGSNTWNAPDLPEYNFYKNVMDTRFPEHAPSGVSKDEWKETKRQLAALKERLG